jgi:hypothetical protein
MALLAQEGIRKIAADSTGTRTDTMKTQGSEISAGPTVVSDGDSTIRRILGTGLLQCSNRPPPKLRSLAGIGQSRPDY